MSKSRFAAALAAVRDRIPGLSPHAYAPLEAASATVDIAGSDEPRDTPWGARNRRLVKMATLALAGAMVLYMVVGYGFNNYRSTPADARTSRLWGQYAPFFSVPSDIDPEVPSGCVVTFAQVLSRHGARDPTAYKTQVYNATVAKIQAGATKFAHGYEFLKDLEYTLGADQLTQFGIQQMLDQGRVMAERYGHLVRDDNDDGSDGGSALPFLRASGQDRVIDSANNWARGFYGELTAGKGRTVPSEEEYLAAILVVPETEGFNNTLDHGGCTEFEGGPDSQLGNRARDAFADRFVPPVLRRLHEGLGASLHLTRDDVIAIMDLCPFYSVADPEGKLSDFCHLFTRDEWKSYDYYQSLGKYYGYGDGNPLGPTQGVGFVNELVARLTRRPVEDHTSTNTTLTGSPRTFPLDRALYADFSHDNTMISIYSALGLYNGTAPLPGTKRVPPAQAGGFSTSWAVPFAGRAVVEKMRCGGGEEEELVRVLVNDRVMPLKGCGADKLGRCGLGEFVEGLSFAREGGRWGQCFVEGE